jgi:hypothetical protein
MNTGQDYIYDIETYPNIFTCAIKHYATGHMVVFELSERRNDLPSLVDTLRKLGLHGCRMIGFNNEAFDYPVLHFIIMNAASVTVKDIYDKALSIIMAPDNARFANMIWDKDRVVEQIDLFKIHHFDNRAKSTSLKMIEFNRRSTQIQELPYPPGTCLTFDQMDYLIKYNKKDVNETEGFYIDSLPQIEFRYVLSEKYGQNMMNYNDTKIGKSYFIMRLEEAMPGVCFHKVNGKRTPRQTPREKIVLRDILFPYIKFNRLELQRVHRWFYDTVLTETKDAFKDLNAVVDGFRFDFGTGGIHGSIPSTIVYADDEHDIVDVDVTSYYPSLAIANNVYPEHLTSKFCEIYADVKEQRVSYAKGTPENAMLKLALNGVYGDSNNQYGPFYDPRYTMTITINGQLLLAMLSEWVMTIPGLTMVQANTDGITVRCPKKHRGLLKALCDHWENVTGLELEEAEYSRMFIRDVNSYIAEYVGGGKYKHKGAYVLNHTGAGKDVPSRLQWHQNQSALVVPKAAEAALVRGEDIETFIRNHRHVDPLDFMLRTKVPRNSRLMWGDKEEQRISRYYISNEGHALTKIMPPTPAQLRKNPNAPERKIGINVGWTVQVCNDHTRLGDDVNYEYYVQEARKLVDPLM